jgi:hypothetical protein
VFIESSQEIRSQVFSIGRLRHRHNTIRHHA